MKSQSRFLAAMVHNEGRKLPPWVRESLARAGIDLVERDCETTQELLSLARDADVLWVLSGSRVVNEDNLALFPRCKAVLRTGSGTDNVPVKKATEMGIIVANTPDGLTDAVAEHAVALIFAVARKIPALDRYARQGVWKRELFADTPILRGKTVGIVGFGRIGRAVAQLLASLRVKLVVHNPDIADDVIRAAGVEPVGFEALLRGADFVTLHCALTPATQKLIGERELRMMKPTAYLINTARGGIVDEAALTRALRERWIAGAGLDVLDQEPPAADHPFFAMDNVVITPHMASHSEEFFPRMYEASVETIIAVKEGRRPASVVTPDARPPRAG